MPLARKWHFEIETCSQVKDMTFARYILKLSPCSEWYFLIFRFTHGAWPRLGDDVSELFVGSVFKGQL
jgi:hypothetical protein